MRTATPVWLLPVGRPDDPNQGDPRSRSATQRLVASSPSEVSTVVDATESRFSSSKVDKNLREIANHFAVHEGERNPVHGEAAAHSKAFCRERLRPRTAVSTTLRTPMSVGVQAIEIWRQRAIFRGKSKMLAKLLVRGSLWEFLGSDLEKKLIFRVEAGSTGPASQAAAKWGLGWPGSSCGDC